MHLGGLFHNSAIAYFAQRIDRYFGQKKGRKLQIYLRNLRGRSEDRNKKSLLQQVQLFRGRRRVRTSLDVSLKLECNSNQEKYTKPGCGYFYG